MASSVDIDEAEIIQMLYGLLDRLGVDRVVRDLQVSPDDLADMLSGSAPVPPESLDRVRRVHEILGGGVETAGGLIPENERLGATAPIEEDHVSPELAPPVYEPRVPRSEDGLSGARQALEDLKADLFRVRMMAVRQQVGVGLRDDEKLASKLFVIQIELTLIVEFRETVPVPGLGWTALQFDEEAERRFRRRDRLQAALSKYNAGFRGLVRRLTGRRPQSVDEMMQAMLQEAEDIHRVGDLENEQTDAVLTRLLGPSGLDADGVRELVRQHAVVA